MVWHGEILVRVEVTGHAPTGQPELCNAVSCLLRSGAESLEVLREKSLGGVSSETLEWALDLPREGEFFLSLHCWPNECEGILRGISLVLSCGLRRLARDFPTFELTESPELLELRKNGDA
ncbi:hypothetical protein P0082_10170 [Candidatus Haliotispira prima]|uniref:Uncharacterized protein n=1 Tax=Candidatus Haliotispira prima TaxID=3034016 RepID=A0ABY8MFT4_9SPIO|nr:hypothetical protein P0082_10170 [Candidatus Haliotispira prima]